MNVQGDATRGWTVRVPVKAEHVSIGRQPVVYERVRIATNSLEEMYRVQAVLRREELRTEEVRTEERQTRRSD